jgi:hypothetical protein
MRDDLDTDNDPNKVEEFVETMKDIHEPKHSVLDQILAWVGTSDDDKPWLAHVINEDKPCGCIYDADGYNQYCEAWTSELALKAQQAEYKIRLEEEDRRRIAIAKQKERAKELGVPFELLP